MESVFSSLSDAVNASAPIALAAAFVWGIFSIILSPCHLAGIPLIVAFTGEQRRGQAFTLALVFALGVLITIAVVGAITAALGRLLGDVGGYVNYGLALVFLYLGLHFLDVVPLPWTGSGPSGPRRRGPAGALLLGLVFGIGVGPCTFAYMAPMLGVTLKVATTSWGYGVALLLLYALGHCSVIVVAGTSAQWAQGYLNWHEGSRGATRLRQVCGVLVILGGAYLLYAAP